MECATPKEMMAVFISRHIRNGEYVALGANLPISTAGVILAHFTHAPDLKLGALSYLTNMADLDEFGDLAQVTDPALMRGAEAILSLEQALNAVPRMDLCFTGCLQVDIHGNTNLIGVGHDHRALQFRGPGSLGSSTVMALVRRSFIHTGNHSPRTLVERCDFRSAVGWD